MFHDDCLAACASWIANTRSLWAQLHVGPPGDIGELAGAVEPQRVATRWVAGGPTLTSIDVLRWERVRGVPGYPQRITHLSFWTEPENGQCWLTTPLTPILVPHNATLEIPAGIKARL